MKQKKNLISSMLVIILTAWNLYSVMISDSEYSTFTVLFVGVNIYLFSVYVKNIVDHFNPKAQINYGYAITATHSVNKARGSELIFIFMISRLEDKLTDLSEVDMTHNKDEIFNINCLSMTNKTYIASGYNSYIVKFKND